MKRPVFVLALAATACTKIPSDGFAAIKFGMTTGELKPLGFDCGPNDFSCFQSASPPFAGRATLFDKPARLSVRTVAGKVAAIDVGVDNYSPDELITMFKEAYGNPRLCRYHTVMGGTAERHIWESNSGATITVITDLERGMGPSFPLGGIHSLATYADAALSAESERGCS